jgi:hypothetical protein
MRAKKPSSQISEVAVIVAFKAQNLCVKTPTIQSGIWNQVQVCNNIIAGRERIYRFS